MSGVGKRGPTGTRRPAGRGRLAVLVATLATGYAVLCPVAFLTRGTAGVWAATAAALVCLVGGAAGLGLDSGVASAHHARLGLASGVMAGMLLRMAVPLAAAMIAYRRGGVLVEGGMAFYLVALYMLTLTAGTRITLSNT